MLVRSEGEGANGWSKADYAKGSFVKIDWSFASHARAMEKMQAFWMTLLTRSRQAVSAVEMDAGIRAAKQTKMPSGNLARNLVQAEALHQQG